MLHIRKHVAFALVLCAVLSLVATTAYAAGWYCPRCGLYNADNFCPKDGTAKPILDDHTAVAQSTYVWGLTTTRLATRSGPSTGYTEPGTFRVENQYVKIYSIAYDVNSVPWVQCEIDYSGKLMRVYTGLKRFDTSTFDVSAITEEWNHGNVKVTTGCTLKYGPGNDYASMKNSVSSGKTVRVTNEENGWYQIELEQNGKKVRGWLPTSYAK